MGNLERRCVSLALLLLLLCCAVPIASQLGGCPVPSEDEINTALQTLLEAEAGVIPLMTTTLYNHHFTCLGGIQSRDRYRFLSVLTNFTSNDMTMGVAQFQMQCNGTNFIIDTQLGAINLSPDSSVFDIPTRVDCWACATPTPFFMNDPITHCFICNSVCQPFGGQGACKADSPVQSNCCPFFHENGTCTLSCPTHYEASNITEYTCECVLHDAYNCSCFNFYIGQNCETCGLECDLGYGPDDNCTLCEAKHDCLTNNPCQNGAMCVIDSPTINNYTCICAHQHFTGQHCDVCIYPCLLGYDRTEQCDGCIAVHRCVTDDPCLNGSTCDIGSGGNDDYSCYCADGFTARHCDLPCNLTCPAGYQPDDVCGGCKAVHICIIDNPCQYPCTCVISDGRDVNNYKCNCVVGQCIVSEPTIIASSSSVDVCQPLLLGSISFTCINNNSFLIWNSLLLTDDELIVSGFGETPPLTIGEVLITERHFLHATSNCFTSIVTATGNLTALNEATVDCGDGGEMYDTSTITIPRLTLPGPTTLAGITQSPACDGDGSQVTIQWTPPTNTASEHITQYEVTVVAEGDCSASNQLLCDVNTTSTTTNTIITGLQCNTIFMVSVRAVNCVGQKGTPSQTLMFHTAVATVSGLLWWHTTLIVFGVIFLVVIMFMIVFIGCKNEQGNKF